MLEIEKSFVLLALALPWRCERGFEGRASRCYPCGLLSALAAGSWLVLLKADAHALLWQCAGLQAEMLQAQMLRSLLGRQLILLLSGQNLDYGPVL